MAAISIIVINPLLLHQQHALSPRIAAIRQIRKLIIEGVSHGEIQEELGLSERTYFRYLQKCFDQERKRIAQIISDEQIMTQIAITEARFQDMWRNVRSIATNEKVDPKIRLEAEKLAAEIAIGILRIYQESPTAAANSLRRNVPEV